MAETRLLEFSSPITHKHEKWNSLLKNFGKKFWGFLLLPYFWFNTTRHGSHFGIYYCY